MEGLSQNEKIIWSCWEEKSLRDVVREASAKGTHINLCFKYLMHKNNWNEATATDWFMAEVKAWTVQLLMRKQIFKVLHILGKVNVNPEKHLMILAQTSPQIEYRDFIVEHLEKTSKDFLPENISRWQDFKKHWHLLRYLEKSFEVDGKFKQNKVFGTGKSRIVVNESEIKALSIENIEKYPPQWKSKIATALFFESFEFSLLDFSTPCEVWNHLIENNKAMILVRWINVQTSEVVRDMNARYNFFNNDNFATKLLNVDTKGFDRGVLDKLDGIFRQWPITNEMVASVAENKCYPYTKMCIYDTLSSYGIINEEEIDNLYSIIARLGRTQNLKLIDDIFSEKCATLNKQQFYVQLAKYFVKNRLYKALTMCIDGNILQIDLSDVEKEARDCIELWLLFKSIEQTSDRQSHVVPVYKTCEQIAKDDISAYISSNPQLVLGMILLEDNAKLFDIFTKDPYLEFRNFQLPNKGYKTKLTHLYNVYKKFSASQHFNTCKDVNVYQLLSGYRGLDISKIFEFQLVNHTSRTLLHHKPERRSLGSLLSNEDVSTANIKPLTQKPIDMPDFEDKELMKRYGYVAKLNYIYYLKQYRPCNASQAFVEQQYLSFNRLQEKSIKNACCEVHALALQNWSDSAMTTCVISFIAMIGCNPTRCRVHISAAKIVKEYLITCKGLSAEKSMKIVNELTYKLIQSEEDAAKDILRYLEEALMVEIKGQQSVTGKLDMTIIIFESQTMIKFAILHRLPLPETILREFIKAGSWFNFLLFGDIFRYPLSQMLQLSQEFQNKAYAEHLKHIMLHKNSEESSEKDSKSTSNSSQRRMTRMNSEELTPTQEKRCSSLEFSSSLYLGRELWEIAASCHGPEDPPAALLRAAAICREPLLVLIASCYEPNAVDVLWAQWILSSLGPSVQSKEFVQLHVNQEGVTDEQFIKIAELCLQEGYISTLHESILIFMPESPLKSFTSFLHRCIRGCIFDSESVRLLSNFLQNCQRKYSTDDSNMSWQLSKDTLQKLAVSLTKISVSCRFDSALLQKEFLRCLAEAKFEKNITSMFPQYSQWLFRDIYIYLLTKFLVSVSTPNYAILYEILQISMESSFIINISKMLQDNPSGYINECLEIYIDNKNYDVALKIAKLLRLPVNDILKSEWTHKYEVLTANSETDLEEKDLTLFIAQCSEAFKNAGVSFKDATDFLIQYAEQITESVQKFYTYRIIMSWFLDNHEYGNRREQIEHKMWQAYFQSECQHNIFLNSYFSTFHFILNGQKDSTMATKIGQINADKPFSMEIRQIEVDSDVANIEDVRTLDEPEVIDKWRRVTSQLIELRLLVDAFRLSALYKTSSEYRYGHPACPVQIIRTCLKLAEGSMSPYEIPQELRLVISSSVLHNKITVSGASDASFEELVVIQEKQDNVPESSHLAAREEADRLSALDALAVRSGLTLVKQVASYFRIALQIGWDYLSVLKHNRSIDFINLVSGRSRMSLANLVFKTFNIPTNQVAEYLCREMVAAIISPHLVKTSTFRQKEHFQYTLWGYTLSSDLEMFLNMRPDACSHIGRFILDHLVAFQRMYKATTVAKLPENTLDDSNLDVETLIDEEYQHVEAEEKESLLTEDGTMLSAETESIYSVTSVYTVGNKRNRDSRRNLFDVITKSNLHIRYEVKSTIRKITMGAKLSTKQVNIISIELLVLAHECFSSACDTEGVAVTLRSAQALTNRLLVARSWRLMVRLLTGLARYTECAYVFQILRDNHQFEFLLGQFDYMLGQQPEKIAEFKQGLLDFLKTHCPGDTDTYIMVALHFNMYAEAANVKRKQAMSLIDDLEKMAMDAAKATGKRPFQPPTWLQIHDSVMTRLVLS
ncbi:hypothetical protein ACJJTC_006543 [Scirpophaga incertulas]